MEGKKSFFRRYYRSLLTFLAWLVLVIFVFTSGLEEPTWESVLTACIALPVWELLLGFRMDRAAIKAEREHLAREERERLELGERAWREREEKRREERKRDSRSWHKQIGTGLLIDAAACCVYAAFYGASHGGGWKWLKGGVPVLLVFLVFFLVPAVWLGAIPKRAREKKLRWIEVLLVWPFFLLPFVPLALDCGGQYLIAAMFALLGYEFVVFGMGYLCQERKKGRACTCLTTAKVVGNVKSRLNSPGKRYGVVLTYQPVVEYYAAGQPRRVTCGDGQPRPLSEGTVCEILYDPANPEDFRFREARHNFTQRYGGYIAMGFGLFFAAVGVCIWLFW